MPDFRSAPSPRSAADPPVGAIFPVGAISPAVAHYGVVAAFASLLLSGCSDGRLAGTSSGVDNPKLTLAFTDSDGAATRFTGAVDLYGAQQNPAVDPNPLLTIKVENSSFTNLSGGDFERILRNPAFKAPAAMAALGPDSTVAFNIIFKTAEGKGSLTFGLAYHGVLKSFSGPGGDTIDRIDLRPAPTVRYQAVLRRIGLLSDLPRIYIPGTPYLSSLVDSGFVFEDLAEGVYPLQVLTRDGNIFPVKELLDSKTVRDYTSPPNPVGKVKIEIPIDSFKIDAGPDREAYVGVASGLAAKLVREAAWPIAPSILWRQILYPGDPLPRVAVIRNPTSLQTEVKFLAEGVYTFEVSALVRLRAAFDTVVVSVRIAPNPTEARILRPLPRDSVYLGLPYKIAWQMPSPGPVTIRFSANGGSHWDTLAVHYQGREALPFFEWIPLALGPSQDCLLEVALESDLNIVAKTRGAFALVTAPVLRDPIGH